MAGKSGRTIVAVPEREWQKRIFSWEGMLVVIFVLVNIFCMMISPNYTFTNVLREMPKYLAEIFLLLMMAYILILGEIDLSVGASVCLAATLACMASNAGIPLPAVILIALAVGAVCGLVNGIIITQFPELPPMIVTLGTMILFRGIAEIILGSGGSISLTTPKVFKVLSGRIGPFPYVFFLVLIGAIIFIVILRKTTFGRRVYAIGSNNKAAVYAGVHTKKIRIIVYVLAGVMAGICAIYMIAVSYGANTTTGNGFELDVIAMAVFGGISNAGGKGKLIGGMISAFTIVCLRIGLGQINLNPQIILIILGALLVLAVLVPNVASSLGLKKKKSNG